MVKRYDLKIKNFCFREFLIQDFKIPVLFPLEKQEYEELALVVVDDCNSYDYSKMYQSSRFKEKVN